MSGRSRRVVTESGFTILSVLVAVVLIGVAVVALSGTTVYVLSLQTEAGVRSTSAGLASAYMEAVKTRRMVALVSEPDTQINELGEVDETGVFVRRLTVGLGPAPRSKLVTVTVLYPRGMTGMGKVELVTIIYEGVES